MIHPIQMKPADSEKKSGAYGKAYILLFYMFCFSIW